MSSLRYSGLVAVLALVASVSAYAETATIAVAANFKMAMERLVTDFEAQTGHKVAIAYGSSGKLYAQILRGAPFDAFFSADVAKPDALEREGEVVDGSRFSYAVGALVLWARDESLTPGPDWLRQGSYRRIALANPRLAPYGAAALQALTALDLVAVTQRRWVQGENVAQTYQFVATGNAEAGFIARSQLRDTALSSVWQVPEALHDPITQDAVLLKRGAGNSAAKALLRFVQSASGVRTIVSSGYSVPGKS